MTLRHFKLFVAVCDTMNMTAAAEMLFISQSAVSQAIAELEKYYDVRLFERLSRKLYLTQAGEKLLSYARHMIHMNETIEKDMKTLLENGSIRLGASITVATCVLPALITSFKQTNPQADMTVVEDNTEQIEKLLLADQTDIGLVEGEIAAPELLSKPFMHDELVLICNPEHRFSNMSAVPPNELQKEDFIVREQGSGTRKTFENAIAAYKLPWKASWICNNTDTIKAAVSAGLGISVISGLAVQKEIQAGELVARPVANIAFTRSFQIVYHKNKYLTTQMKSFIRLCPSAAECTA